MSAYAALLRGINVGGQKQLRMETLRGIFEASGFTDVRSYVQSGNVVFEAAAGSPAILRKKIETAIQSTCGYRVPVFIRKTDELRRVLESNPFLNPRNEDPSKLYVTFLYESLPESAWSKVIAHPGIPDEFARGEEEIYLFCPNGYGKTKLSNSFFERKLGILTTTRNWNTVKALYKMMEG